MYNLDICLPKRMLVSVDVKELHNRLGGFNARTLSLTRYLLVSDIAREKRPMEEY